MKRILPVLLGCMFCCLYVQAHAATGDVTGNIYPTDIRAYINGVEVPSYNIGGRTTVVIEDILTSPYDYVYSDYYRTLKIFSLGPDRLRAGVSSAADTAAGYIYETNIKTTIYDVEVPSYNIGGKTMVAIEELGGDAVFSEIGGRYFWNPDDRTIRLEFLFGDGKENQILQETDKDVSYTVSGDFREVQAHFQDAPLSGGGSITYEWPEGTYPGESWKAMHLAIPITSEFQTGDTDINKNKVIGYYFQHPTVEGFTAFVYVYEDLYRAAAENTPSAQLTRDEVIRYYMINRVGNVLERFDTDAYSFVYMSTATPHGAIQYLLLVNADGSYRDFGEDLQSGSLYGTKKFENVRIDRENQKVYLHYDADYVIDLCTGTMQKME